MYFSLFHITLDRQSILTTCGLMVEQNISTNWPMSYMYAKNIWLIFNLLDSNKRMLFGNIVRITGCRVTKLTMLVYPSWQLYDLMTMAFKYQVNWASVFENLHHIIFVVVYNLCHLGVIQRSLWLENYLYSSIWTCKLSCYDEFLFPIIYCFIISL